MFFLKHYKGLQLCPDFDFSPVKPIYVSWQTGEMAQQIKVLAAKSEPEFDPWNCTAEGKKWLLQAVLRHPHVCHGMCIYSPYK